MVSLCLVENSAPVSTESALLAGYGPATEHISEIDCIIFEQLLCLDKPLDAQTNSKASPRIRLVKPVN